MNFLGYFRKDLLSLCALIIPWVNPFALGPSPPVVQSLVTVSCFSAVILLNVVKVDIRGLARICIFGWIIAGLTSSLLGVLQYIGAASPFSPWLNTTALGEAYANLRQRNQFATLTNIALVAALLQVAQTRSNCFKSGAETAHKCLGNWTTFGIALLAMGNAASSSRTGLVQLFVIALLVMWWGHLRQPNVRWNLLVAVLSYAFASFVLPRLAGLDPSSSGILARLQDGGPACASRLTLWNNVLHLIAQKPWAGWGWGELDYAHFMTLYPGPRFCEILDNAHNLPLHLAVELGLPIAMLLSGWASWLVIRAKPWRETDATRQIAWAILALIMLHSTLEYPLWYGPFQMTFAICIWLLWRKPQPLPALLSTTPNPEEQSNRATTSTLITGLAFMLLASTAYAAWDYHRISQIYLAPEARSEAYRDNTLAKAGASWLFRGQVQFAELTTADLTPENALEINTLAKEVQHFSPESRVVIKIIESAVMLGRNDEVQFYVQRFKAAYPLEHERWVKGSASEDVD